MSSQRVTLPSQPHDENGPVFRQPWEAQAFAMTLALHERGVFSWTEWGEALARQIREAGAKGDAELGDTYYHHWLEALERLVAAKGAASIKELTQYRRAWERAATRTPHGHSIELQSADFGA
jgi:nitrile hydratase accessory protein